MKKLHVTDLSDAEISAVFSTAVRQAVARAEAAGHDVPTIRLPDVAPSFDETHIAAVAERLKQEARERLAGRASGTGKATSKQLA